MNDVIKVGTRVRMLTGLDDMLSGEGVANKRGIVLAVFNESEPIAYWVEFEESKYETMPFVNAARVSREAFSALTGTAAEFTLPDLAEKIESWNRGLEQ